MNAVAAAESATDKAPYRFCAEFANGSVRTSSVPKVSTRSVTAVDARFPTVSANTTSAVPIATNRAGVERIVYRTGGLPATAPTGVAVVGGTAAEGVVPAAITHPSI